MNPLTGLETALGGLIDGMPPISAPPPTDPVWSINRAALRAATGRTDPTPGLRIVHRNEQVPT